MTTSIISVSETESKIQVNGLDALTFNSAGNLGVKSINGGQLAGMRNRIINGGMQIAQRGAGALVASNDTYNGCDRTFAAPYGFTTVSGTIAQGGAFGGPYSSSGFLQGITITTTGSGVVRLGQKVESSNTVDLNGGVVTVQCKLAQDSGTSISAFFTVYKANSRDDFTSQTLLSTSPSLPVASNAATPTQLTHTFTLGNADATNGLAVYVTYTGIGAVAGKTFYIGDLQLERGPVATPFEHRPYGMELALCQRYAQPAPIITNGVYGLAGNVFQVNYSIPQMRAAPSVTPPMTFATTNCTAAVNGSSVNALGVTYTITATGAWTAATNNSSMCIAEI